MNWRGNKGSERAMRRRDLLKLGLGGAVLFAPGPWAWVRAQTAQDAQLLRLPKMALVMGNAGYPQAPLKNPTNDAKGVAAALNSLGFEVTVRLDAGRAAMQSAVEAYVEQLARRKCVGLFYFAGHGIQINWKNYLLPVDAEFKSNEDVIARAVEVNRVIDGLNRARNALNLIILDACRDAPFGEAMRSGQRGLSQMDAPRNTLLAYSTAPGNVAGDGAGANGLYTESLLREIKVPDAKVEDVFKRVRLAVRRKSNGAQIPWESTSLEDDYYFVPPASLAPPTDAQAEKRFAEELKLWEQNEAASTPAPLEEYLRRYPSGNFSELAQFRLDRVLAGMGEKRIEIAPQKDNPYTAGTAMANTAFKVGDTYTYRISEMESGKPIRGVERRVTAISENEVIFNHGKLRSDLLGNWTRFSDGRRLVGAQFLPAEYAVGKTWTARYNGSNRRNQDFYTEVQTRIVTREKVTVPAGTFDCFRLESKGVSRPFLPPSWNTQLHTQVWMSPENARLCIKQEIYRKTFGHRTEVHENDRWELASFKQS